MRDLPPVNNAPCSNGNAINNRDEVVGNLTDCQGSQLAAAFWSNGHAYDLNTLVAPSALHLTSAEYINSRERSSVTECSPTATGAFSS